jgi:DNA-binding NarL/FixJ family response regulator
VIRILIADDHEVIRYGLRKILERQAGWQVVAETSNGKDAISKALETMPDVAILDYAMPLMNGVEATRQIRACLPNTEVLIFTAYDDDELIQQCLRAGARSYLLKRFTQSQLLSAIEFLAMHKPFFTGKAADTLLSSFLATPHDMSQVMSHKHDLPAPVAAVETSVLQLAAKGHSEQQIAERLNMNVKLVKALMKVMRNGLLRR